MQQTMRQMAGRPVQRVAVPHWTTRSRALPSPQALVSPQKGHISKGNSSDLAQASRCTRRWLT